MKSCCWFFLLAIILLPGCAIEPFTADELSEIKTVGVINSFPDFPKFTVTGFWKSVREEVPDEFYKEYLSKLVVDSLEDKGYQVVVLDKDDTQDTVDVTVEIVPWELPVGGTIKTSETNGYGFAETTVFGIEAFKIAYVILTLEPYLAGRYRCDDKCRQGGGETRSLPIDDLPDNWEDLSPAQQKEFKELLRQCIKSAVDLAVPRIGI